MSSPIQLTVTLELTVPADLTRDTLRPLVETRLRQAFGDALMDHHTVAVCDPRGPLNQPPWLLPLFRAFGLDGLIWSAGDVLDICPQLTNEQARLVLHHALQQETVSQAITDAFPEQADALFDSA